MLTLFFFVVVVPVFNSRTPDTKNKVNNTVKSVDSA